MKKILKISITIMMILSVVVFSVFSVSAGNEVFIDDDFEDATMIENWEDTTYYKVGVKQIEADEKGHYLAMTATSSYFNFVADDVYSTEVLYCTADVYFIDSMEIQLREKWSNAADGSVIAGRLKYVSGYMEYYSGGKNYMKNSNGTNMIFNNLTWYKIKMVFDIPGNTYSIYIFDRETGEELSRVQDVPFQTECSKINYFAFSGTNKLCVDNVKIEQIDIKNVKISGENYPQTSKMYTYRVKAFNEDNVEFMVSGIQWSLNKEVEGVSIDESTGELAVSETAKPGPLIIYAKNILYPDIQKTFLIDIER